MNNTIQHYKQCIADYRALLAISKKADPASGVTFAVRQGVARDNPDVEHDAQTRPWVTVEMADFKAPLDILIELQYQRILYWRRSVEQEAAAFAAAVAEAVPARAHKMP